LERTPSCRHFVQDRAERKQIRSRVDRLSARLLGRHIRGCAEHHARLGERGLTQPRQIVVRGDWFLQLGKTEVQDLYQPGWRDDDICRLDVAMHDARRVRNRQSTSHLCRVLQHVGERQPRIWDGAIQR
jgi:hypothetical protein